MSEPREARPTERPPSRRELRRRREAALDPEELSREPGDPTSAGEGRDETAPEYTEDLRTLTSEIAAVSAGDPHHVDPDLKRRQEEMAERVRRENRARRGLPPEDDESGARDIASPVAPIDASGAHGLDLDPLAEETQRAAARRNRLVILLIIVIVLLMIAVGVALSMPS